MERQELMAIFAAILVILADEAEGCPESTLYMVCRMDMGKWETVRRVLMGNPPLVTIKGHWVTLTADGKTMAAKINAALKVG